MSLHCVFTQASRCTPAARGAVRALYEGPPLRRTSARLTGRCVRDMPAPSTRSGAEARHTIPRAALPRWPALASAGGPAATTRRLMPRRPRGPASLSSSSSGAGWRGAARGAARPQQQRQQVALLGGAARRSKDICDPLAANQRPRRRARPGRRRRGARVSLHILGHRSENTLARARGETV
eukprot:scaffold3691_cov394-Prasinococcus_capsulatus_cf.AAC.7